jgi:hypothetical protein
MLEPLKVKMSRKELEQRMKEIKKEEEETLEREKKANDEYLASVKNKLV